MRLLLLVGVVLALSTQVEAKPGEYHQKIKPVAQFDDGWQLVLQTPNWWLAKRPHPSHGQYEYLARLITQAPAAAIFSLLKAHDRVPEWAPRVHSTKVMQQQGGYYQVVSLFHPPWPIRNRELISDSWQWRDESSSWLEIHSTPSIESHHPGYLRIQTLENCWHARSRADGASEIFYLGHLEDPGLIPDFLVNPAVAQSLTEMLDNLQRLLPGQPVSHMPFAKQSPKEWHYCERLKPLLEMEWSN